MSVRPIPHGFHSVTPYLRARDAAAAILFYKVAFGAEEAYRLADPSGKVMHAEIVIGDTHLMLSDEFPEWGIAGPQTLGGTSVGLAVYVEYVDAAVERAVAAGGTLVMPVADQFYGDRSGKVLDPFGHEWTLATHTEDVSPEEIGRRFESWMTAQASA
ncbi:VOC family protein [Tundrisphaera lichenicola]|uniref:VOC family protein n=1 Tax=Tundrisphaera lichenicola TaxID=2029860 RepID=UPI003EBBCD88